ncbi:FGGY family carbohydrate kinase [Dongia rigui]|uniref:ATP:glycerol 3-phosphotransferase n=1 Tax=Dongia rigui TaxID=940149 RepID=A0ABU5E048_9PROT|nr:FGGY family carbohydrate kinase [Dongia rigui]MDY0872961.1 FGGY family carbohydrate kinase [Dongia rigui]
MSDFVLAIDQGTTGTKPHLLHIDGRFETLPGFEHKQILPQPGWVEHDPEELITHLEGCLAKAGPARAIGIANQGETVVAWDAQTKRAIYHAIVWQDARTNDAIGALKEAGHEETTLARAGLPLDPYFSASKLRWLLDNVDEATSLRRQGRLRLGTSDAFFLDRLAGIFATDVTTASRTSLMNLETLAWDPVLCDLFGVPMECLPQIRATADDFGTIGKMPVTASVVDQQAALFGHGCRKTGDAKITFGTGAFALCIAGDKPLRDVASGLLPTIAWRLRDAAPAYALEGGVYNAASAVNWARNLGLFADYAEIDSFASASAISRGLAFVPALSGLGCPYWDRSAAGMWLGLGLDTSKADMMQALLEGIALRAGEVIAAMSRLAPIGARISIDGGLAKNAYFGRFVADVLGRETIIPASTELTGLGTAQLALIGAGLATIDTLPPPPAAKARLAAGKLADEHRMKFHTAVSRSRNWR